MVVMEEMKNSRFGKSMYDYFRDETAHLPDGNITCAFFGAHYDKARFMRDVEAVSGYLHSLGIGRGDNVVLCLGNVPDAIVSFYAINACGAVANLVHPLITREGLKDIVDEADPKALILFDAFYADYLPWVATLNKPTIVCSASDYLPRVLAPFYRVLERAKFRVPKSARTVRYRDVLTAPPFSVPSDGDADAIYMHSGGTTGKPKTVVLSHDSFNHLADNAIALIGGQVDDRDGMLMVLPIFHNFGLGICMHTVLCAGGQVVLMPKFDAKGACRLVKRERATFISGVPNMYAKMLDCGKFKGAYLRKLKNCYCGGDKLSPRTREKFEQAVLAENNPIKINEGYGLTEAGICCVNTPQHYRQGSIGKPLKHNTFGIVDEELRFLPPDTAGEIVIACDTLMTRYYKDKEATERAFFYDESGVKWFRTGDCGSLDADGYVYFKERLKRLVKISGVNVFPRAIDEVASQVSGVKLCCAVKCDIGGKSAIKLYVVLDDGVKWDAAKEREIGDAVEAKLMKYSRPRLIEAVDSLPLTDIGKVNYKKLEARDAHVGDN